LRWTALFLLLANHAQAELKELGPDTVDDPSAKIPGFVLFQPKTGPAEVTGVSQTDNKSVSAIARRLCRKDGQPSGKVKLFRKRLLHEGNRVDMVAVHCE
jgi:hypothetical protein